MMQASREFFADQALRMPAFGPIFNSITFGYNPGSPPFDPNGLFGGGRGGRGGRGRGGRGRGRGRGGRGGGRGRGRGLGTAATTPAPAASARPKAEPKKRKKVTKAAASSSSSSKGTKKTKKQASDPTCSICFTSLKNNGAVHSLSCGHTFHTAEINEWFMEKGQRICPVCKHRS